MKTVAAASPIAWMTSCTQHISDSKKHPDCKSNYLSRQSIYEALFDYTRSIEIIDAHEHLFVEKRRIQMDADVLMLLAQYNYVDMTSAGYKPRTAENMFTNNLCLDTSVPLEQRWQTFWPHLQNIKHGSYYRAAKIALKDLYGIDDLNEKTYREASEKIKAANKAGLYRSILRDRCKIKTCLVQNGHIEGQDPPDLMTPVFTGTHGAYSFWNLDYIKELQPRYDLSIENLNTYMECVGRDMQWAKEHGAVACKIFIEPQAPLDWDSAHKDFKAFLSGSPSTPALRNAVLDFILQKSHQLDWPVAVHTGVWGDFRIVDPKHVIDLIQRYPDIRFDIYHLGMPYVRDCIFIGKNFPNAYLNLCWAYILSQWITEQAIKEIIDTVPVNKIFAFGGDYTWSVENVYGHLTIAQKTLAQAFAHRIHQGWMDLDDAKYILKSWLYDNPNRFYRL